MRREKIERVVSEPVKKAWRWSGCSGTYHVNERREKILESTVILVIRATVEIILRMRIAVWLWNLVAPPHDSVT